ncbi:MAG: hypothetical protein NC177_03490 [Ruminococcus flavefaciens]|nr:hypothetical protein [Ruminococcus flavefaciens]
MGNVVLEFIRDSVSEITNIMKETIIFSADSSEFFKVSVTLWDIFIGVLTASTIMSIFGFDD